MARASGSKDIPLRNLGYVLKTAGVVMVIVPVGFSLLGIGKFWVPMFLIKLTGG